MNADHEASVASPGKIGRETARKPSISERPLPAPTVQRSPWLEAMSWIAALVVLIGFAILVYQMLSVDASTTDGEWSRKLVIFNSVQALAFGAAGLLFGSRIEKANTAAANQVATQATERWTQALENAWVAVDNGAYLRRRLGELAAGGALESSPSSAAGVTELLVEAARLFPDD